MSKLKKSQFYISFQNLTLLNGRIGRSRMTRWMRQALFVPAELTVRFVDRREGYRLNKTYRNRDYATNVLTFDFQHYPVAQADIVLCVPVLRKRAKEQNKTFVSHCAHLLIHGVLHAQGWDHLTDERARVMEAIEVQIMERIGFENPYGLSRAVAHN